VVIVCGAPGPAQRVDNIPTGLYLKGMDADSHDADYRFGRPKLYLAPHELARLTILRSRLGDTQAERLAYASDTHGSWSNVGSAFHGHAAQESH
jgi:hypothetical protein